MTFSIGSIYEITFKKQFRPCTMVVYDYNSNSESVTLYHIGSFPITARDFPLTDIKDIKIVKKV